MWHEGMAQMVEHLLSNGGQVLSTVSKITN
jgi:hypothetical protein